MFISSYNTYNDISNLQKNNKNKSDRKGSVFTQYRQKSIKTFNNNALYIKPISYLYSSKTFNNKYRLQEQNSQKSQIKFTKLTSISHARDAYEESSKIYSFFKSTNISINQTPKINKNLPQELKKLKTENLRHTMLDTYIENDKYYKITA